MREIRIPEDVKELIDQLQEYGFEAYAVGGCVRDSLLHREPEDWDITTSAKPEEVKSIFRRTIDTGILHGTVTVMVNRRGYEVTTYRVDGTYEDGRHPASVDFTSSLLEDLKRRDFTMNAMAYNCREGLVDAFGGAEDLERKMVRCVGSASQRFTEDALRILRAIRFSAQLGFAIEEETLEAVASIAPNLVRVSRERIAAELTKTLKSGCPEKISLVFETHASPFISPAFHRLAVKTEAELLGLRRLAPFKYVRWAGFLRREQAETAAALLRELKMDCDTMNKVKILVSNWRNLIPANKPAIRRAMNGVPGELFDALLQMQEVFADELGDAYGQSLVKRTELVCEIRRSGDPVTLKELAVTGRDLVEAGMKPGPELGRTLSRLLDLVLERPEHNTREYLLSVLRQ